eukprot:388680-Prorocentrum_minimum.AAC.1
MFGAAPAASSAGMFGAPASGFGCAPFVAPLSPLRPFVPRLRRHVDRSGFVRVGATEMSRAGVARVGAHVLRDGIRC